MRTLMAAAELTPAGGRQKGRGGKQGKGGGGDICGGDGVGGSDAHRDSGGR